MSLVEPLEDQIKALKEKLRATDEKLQKCKECGHHNDEVNSIYIFSFNSIPFQFKYLEKIF